MAGCVSAPLSEAEKLEREQKRQEFMEDFRLCEWVYQQNNSIWYATAPRDRHGNIRYVEAKIEYARHNCHRIIKRLCRRGTHQERC